MRHGGKVRYAGMVICRQRPGTAPGVTFMTLEDETGFVNIVLWPKDFGPNAILIKTTSFLGVTGRIEAQQGVVHVIAEKLWRPASRSRRPDPRFPLSYAIVTRAAPANTLRSAARRGG